MEHRTRFSLCYRHRDGLLAPLCHGRVTDRGLFMLVLLVSRFRDHFPEVVLVVEDQLISSVALSASGMRLDGHPVVYEEV